jgi:hypothetical protein
MQKREEERLEEVRLKRQARYDFYNKTKDMLLEHLSKEDLTFPLTFPLEDPDRVMKEIIQDLNDVYPDDPLRFGYYTGITTEDVELCVIFIGTRDSNGQNSNKRVHHPDIESDSGDDDGGSRQRGCVIF